MGAFAAPRWPNESAPPLVRRCPRTHRSFRCQIPPRRAASTLRLIPPRHVLPRFRRSRRRRGSLIQTRLSSLWLSASLAAILAAARRLQSSSKPVRRVLAEFFLERCRRQKLRPVILEERCLEGLMARERVEETQESSLVRHREETHQPFRFIVECLDPVRGRIGHRHQLRQGYQFFLLNRARMRPGVVIARAEVTGP